MKTDDRDACYAVIFTAKRKPGDNGYDDVAARMAALSSESPGFLGMEHARSEDGVGITICYWESEQAIAAWKANAEHRQAQERGKSEWYESYTVRIAKVMRAYGTD
ncbi:MAG: antibiotic biosynthesis monooxygenase [Pseudomonadota bacterium]